MVNPILSLRDINKKISDTFSLSNINIDFYPGEVYAIIGENGSGKSSLMNLISGVLSPDSGRMLFNNKNVKFKSIYDGKSHGIYYIPQETNLFDNLTVAENIFINSFSFKYDPYNVINLNKIYHMTQKLFEELSIDLDPQEYVKNMNLSQKQILCFIQAYVADAKLTIFDEPASALTDVENDILFNIIQILKSKGSSIIIISHKIERIVKVGDKLAILKDGVIVEKGNINEFSSDKIIRIMSKGKDVNHFPKLHFDRRKEILSIRNLSYKNSLSNISFSLKKQEVIGIIGSANSGKQQLIQSLFGIITPDSGEIMLNGNNIVLNHPSDAMDKGFALVPEDKIQYSIFHQLDLANNLAMSSLKRFSKSFILDNNIIKIVAKNYISKLNISPGNTDDRVINYSGGNQQKVAFAKSIMHLANIYLLDEPTRGIDIASKNDIYNIINNLLINGSAILLFSSDFDEILGMSDRILILSAGEIIAELNAYNTTKEELIYYLTL